MAKKLYIGVDGVAQEAKTIYVGVDGVARKVKKGFVGDSNGIARLFYEDVEQIIEGTLSNYTEHLIFYKSGNNCIINDTKLSSSISNFQRTTYHTTSSSPDISIDNLREYYLTNNILCGGTHNFTYQSTNYSSPNFITDKSECPAASAPGVFFDGYGSSSKESIFLPIEKKYNPKYLILTMDGTSPAAQFRVGVGAVNLAPYAQNEGDMVYYDIICNTDNSNYAITDTNGILPRIYAEYHGFHIVFPIENMDYIDYIYIATTTNTPNKRPCFTNAAIICGTSKGTYNFNTIMRNNPQGQNGSIIMATDTYNSNIHLDSIYSERYEARNGYVRLDNSSDLTIPMYFSIVRANEPIYNLRTKNYLPMYNTSRAYYGYEQQTALLIGAARLSSNTPNFRLGNFSYAVINSGSGENGDTPDYYVIKYNNEWWEILYLSLPINNTQYAIFNNLTFVTPKNQTMVDSADHPVYVTPENSTIYNISNCPMYRSFEITIGVPAKDFIKYLHDSGEV